MKRSAVTAGVFSLAALALLCAIPGPQEARGEEAAGDHTPAALKYKIGIMGQPTRPDLPWTKENVQRLKDLGFNTLQLNIAWLWRPGDEILNFEDFVPGLEYPGKQSGANTAKQDPASVSRRRADLRLRIRLCREGGLRTLLHIGAPYVGDQAGADPLPQCIMDPAVTRRYVQILEKMNAEFPGVDDLLIYTYDQAAWLCSEFGGCDRCRGVPLDRRVVPFINALAAKWAELRPGGRVWWEPWELSAGQVYKSVEGLDPKTTGLMLHNTIAEVMPTLAVDRFIKNIAGLAADRGIPVVLEGFFTSASEEVEPYQHVWTPLATLRQLRAMTAVLGVVGVKEYYGLYPVEEDPNLRLTALFFADPAIGEDEALRRLAAPYGAAAPAVERYWRLWSRAVELYPWDVSWAARRMGASDPVHSLSAAFVRGEITHTPSWDSTRRAIFMKTDNQEPSPWLLEDVQLRCEAAADRMGEALAVAAEARDSVPPEFREAFAKSVGDLEGMHRRALAFAYHLRETNLVHVMRQSRAEKRPFPASVVPELLETLKKDHANQTGDLPLTAQWIWHPGPAGDDQTVFLRRTFTLPEGKAVRRAAVAIAVDDDFTLYLNGRKLGSGKDWSSPEQLDLTSAIRPGKNVLAVEAHNVTGPCGALAAIRVSVAGGPDLLLVSDGQWSAHDRREPGWQDLPFDDSSWVKAKEIAGCGEGVWGKTTVAGALRALQSSSDRFLDAYFLAPAVNGTPKGFFSWTSR